jgi:hypothetical protein
MSLLRLLTAGKSLVGLKDTEHRYSVARRGLLPKFASKKNPFRASLGAEVGPSPEKEFPSGLNRSEPSEVNSSNGDGPTALLTQPPIEGPAPQTAPLSSSSLEKPVADDARRMSRVWWSAFLPWIGRRTQKPAVPRFEKAMVQGELSLESVKVVRNDLSDSDLEVVPTKPLIPAPQMKPARPVITGAGTNASSWERLTGRFLGAGKT